MQASLPAELGFHSLPVVAAMRVQYTALRPMNGVRLGVTFVTGTLVSVGQGVGGLSSVPVVAGIGPRTPSGVAVPAGLVALTAAIVRGRACTQTG